MSNVQIWLAGCGVLVAIIVMCVIAARRKETDTETETEAYGDQTPAIDPEKLIAMVSDMAHDQGVDVGAYFARKARDELSKSIAARGAEYCRGWNGACDQILKMIIAYNARNLVDRLKEPADISRPQLPPEAA